MATDFRRHGGRLAEARAAFPRAPEPWLDLSTGINPEPWRGPRASAEALTRLPDPRDLAALEAMAAAAFGADAARVAATPGAEAGLRLMPAVTGAGSVGIVTPTYGGHAEAWAGRAVHHYPLTPAKAGAQAASRITSSSAWIPTSVGLSGVGVEARVVVNPNNPDGHAWSRRELADLAQRGWLIVDESFVEAAPELSVADLAGTTGFERLIVLRSFGKFYGLPGARLGFVLGAPEVLAKVRAAFGDWPVCADAVALGAGAYADAAWREASLARLIEDAARLDDLLARAGFAVVGGTPLFRLAEADDAEARFTRLAEEGVLVRPLAEAPHLLRFGLPSAQQWDRLAAALEACA